MMGFSFYIFAKFTYSFMEKLKGGYAMNCGYEDIMKCHKFDKMLKEANRRAKAGNSLCHLECAVNDLRECIRSEICENENSAEYISELISIYMSIDDARCKFSELINPKVELKT